MERGASGRLVPEGYAYVEERSIRKEGNGPCEEVFAATTGKHLSDWYRDTRFCGRCGTRMALHDKERAMSCPACGYVGISADYAGGYRGQ